MPVASASVTAGDVSKGVLTGGKIDRPVNPYEGNIVYEVGLTSSLEAPGYTNPTFTRSTVRASNVLSNELKEWAINTMRFESRGGLLEQAATNYALHNEDLTNAAWVTGNIETPVQSGTGPEEGSQGWKIQASGTPLAYIGQVIAGTNMNGLGFWAKAGNTRNMVVTTQIQAASPQTQAIADVVLHDEWAWYTVPAGAACDTLVLSLGSTSVAPSVGDFVYIYQPCMFDQAEGSRAIPTAATAVTHTADEFTIPVAGLPNPGAAYALAFTFHCVADIGEAATLARFQGETQGRRVSITSDGKIRYGYGTTAVSGSVATNVQAGDTFRVLATGSTNSPVDMKCYLNGVQEISDVAAGFGGTPTSLEFNYTDTAYFVVRDIVVYDRYFETAAEAEAEMKVYV